MASLQPKPELEGDKNRENGSTITKEETDKTDNANSSSTGSLGVQEKDSKTKELRVDSEKATSKNGAQSLTKKMRKELQGLTARMLENLTQKMKKSISLSLTQMDWQKRRPQHQNQILTERVPVNFRHKMRVSHEVLKFCQKGRQRCRHTSISLKRVEKRTGRKRIRKRPQRKKKLFTVCVNHLTVQHL